MKNIFKNLFILFVFTLFIFNFIPDLLAQNILQSKPSMTITSPQAASASLPLYKIKSAVIHYESSSMGVPIPGDLAFYFDNYGEKEARYSYIKFGEIENNDVIINMEGSVISFSLKDKKGTRTKSTGSIIMEADFRDIEVLTPEMKIKLKYKDLGEKEIGGRKCKGFSMTMKGPIGNMQMDGEVWTWDNIPIITEMYNNGTQMFQIMATKIETDVKIPPEKFQVPEDIVIKNEK